MSMPIQQAAEATPIPNTPYEADTQTRDEQAMRQSGAVCTQDETPFLSRQNRYDTPCEKTGAAAAKPFRPAANTSPQTKLSTGQAALNELATFIDTSDLYEEIRRRGAQAGHPPPPPACVHNVVKLNKFCRRIVEYSGTAAISNRGSPITISSLRIFFVSDAVLHECTREERGS